MARTVGCVMAGGLLGGGLCAVHQVLVAVVGDPWLSLLNALALPLAFGVPAGAGYLVLRSLSRSPGADRISRKKAATIGALMGALIGAIAVAAIAVRRQLVPPLVQVGGRVPLKS